MSAPRRLEGRIAVVTAAASGMGRATAIRFAEEGAHVVVADIDDAGAAATVDAIGRAGGSAQAHQIDLTEASAITNLFALVERDHGCLHVLHSNAGFPGPSGIEVDEEGWELTIRLNLRAGLQAAAAALPLLRRNPSQASIIFTSSVAGIVGSPVGISYSAAKGGVIQLAKSLALKLGPEGIRVNVICPGLTDTPMLPKFFGRDDVAEAQEKITTTIQTAIPLGRVAEPRDIANAALFLACDESSYVHGSVLTVDGGYTAR